MSRIIPPPTPVNTPMQIATIGPVPALKALFTPMPTNTARPTASSTGSIHFGNLRGWRTSTIVNRQVTIATTRSVGSLTQKTGPCASAISRIVPPPTAVTTPSTSTPNGSMRSFPASRTPEIAKTAVPRISSQYTSIVKSSKGVFICLNDSQPTRRRVVLRRG